MFIRKTSLVFLNRISKSLKVTGGKFMSKEMKNEELLIEAIEKASEEELQEIAAAGDTTPETISLISITTAGSAVFTCGNGLGCC